MKKSFEDVVMNLLFSKKSPKELNALSGRLKHAALHRRIHVRFDDKMGEFFEKAAASARERSLITWAIQVYDHPDRFSAADRKKAHELAQIVKKCTCEDATTAPDDHTPRATIVKKR